MTGLIPAEHARALVDPTAYADGRIYETYRWLRGNQPLGYAAPEGFDPFWVATRHADVRAISRDNKLFRSGERQSTLTDRASDAFVRSLSDGKPYIARSLIQMDPPDHMKYRLLTQSWFMPKHLKTLDARIAAIADRTVAKMATLAPRCDFVRDVALNYPLEVIMDILGVPPADLPIMLRLTQEIFAPADPDSVPEGVDAGDPAYFAQALKATLAQLEEYFRGISADRRRAPRNDVASLVANALIDGGPMPDPDALGYYTIIATAGHDTTSSTSAAAMQALVEQPDLLHRLKGDPALLPRFIEEAIRWATPVKTFMRSAAEDCVVSGQQIRAGDWIMLCYASANRDEAVVQDGDRFDIDRPPFEHVAFGYGPHLCLGQHLARRELMALFSRLISRIQTVEADGPAEMVASFFVNGLKQLPIRFSLEPERTEVAAA